MSITEFIFNVIGAIGSLATAISLIVLLCNQKGTKKQITSLSQMAETYTKIYQIERIKAGGSINPDIVITFKNGDWIEGIKLLVKCSNYDIIVKRIKIREYDSCSECQINDPQSYIMISRNETKEIPLKWYFKNGLYPLMPKIVITITTSLNETFEMSCDCTNINNIYKLNAQQIAYSESKFDRKRMTQFTNKSHSVHGAFSGKLDEYFPEINKTDHL